jgi:hypothetical protein
VLHLP